MTGDDVAVQLKQEQGYLLYGAHTEKEVGQIILPEEHGDFSFPVRIVKLSTKAAIVKQINRAHEIAPEVQRRTIRPAQVRWPFIYEVEAVD